MKPPEDVKKRIVNDWLDKANADMGLAEHLVSDETAPDSRYGLAAAFDVKR